MRGSKIGIWENDMPGGVHEDGRGHGINMWEQLGYNRPESRTRVTDWFECIHPQDRERVGRGVQAYLAGETPGYKPSTGSGTTTGRTAGSCARRGRPRRGGDAGPLHRQYGRYHRPPAGRGGAARE